MLRVLFITLLLNLAACSSSPNWKGIYGSGEIGKESVKLDVPPDLSAPDTSSAVLLPAIALDDSTYSTYSNVDKDEDTKVASAKPAGIKVVRDGINQWLEIKISPDKLWPELQRFFKQVGFKITRADKALGIIDTSWLESKANLPTNFFSKLLNRMSSTGLRDKYRARLEKTSNPKITRVFITHQGLKEHAVEELNSFKIWWETRASDPELEAEMYQRFLIFRGMGENKAIKLAANSTAKERAQLITQDDSKVLKVTEGFARTWRRVGIALDRIGLLVEDRNRSNGLYYLRVTDDFKEKVKEEKDWLTSLFSSDEKSKLKERYILNVSNEKGQSIISLYEPSGAKANEQFVQQLLTELKSYLN